MMGQRFKKVVAELDEVRDAFAEQGSKLLLIRAEAEHLSNTSEVDVYYSDLTRAQFLIDDACILIAELQCKMENNGESSAADAVRHCNAG